MKDTFKASDMALRQKSSQYVAMASDIGFEGHNGFVTLLFPKDKAIRFNHVHTTRNADHDIESWEFESVAGAFRLIVFND